MPKSRPEEDYATTSVPDTALRPARSIFYIVSGSCVGLSLFILASNVAGTLGLLHAGIAFVVGGAVCGILAAFMVFVGARSRLSFSLLIEQAFNTFGVYAIKVILILSLIGWFAVIVAQFGGVAATAFNATWHLDMSPLLVAVPMCALVTYVVVRGVRWIAALGQASIVLTVALLIASAVTAFYRYRAGPPAGTLATIGFGDTVSAVVGGYIVGVAILPDYSRFVRGSVKGAFAALLALGVVYPASLVLAAIPALLTGSRDYMVALGAIGIAMPALIPLFIGSWVSGCMSLYSGALPLKTIAPRVGMNLITVAGGAVGAALIILRIDAFFIPFLVMLSVTIPPVAVAVCSRELVHWRGAAIFPVRPRDAVTAAWLVGSIVGILSQTGVLRITGIPAIDSILGTGAVLVLGYALCGAGRTV